MEGVSLPLLRSLFLPAVAPFSGLRSLHPSRRSPAPITRKFFVTVTSRFSIAHCSISPSYGGWDDPDVEIDPGMIEIKTIRDAIVAIGITDRKYAFFFLIGFASAVAVSRVRFSNLAALALAGVGFVCGLLAASNLSELKTRFQGFLASNRPKTSETETIRDSAKPSSKSNKRKKEVAILPADLLKFLVATFKDVSVAPPRSNQEIKAGGSQTIGNKGKVEEEDKGDSSGKLSSAYGSDDHDDLLVVDDLRVLNGLGSYARVDQGTDQMVLNCRSSSSSSESRDANSDRDDDLRVLNGNGSYHKVILQHNGSYARIDPDQKVVNDRSSLSSPSSESRYGSRVHDDDLRVLNGHHQTVVNERSSSSLSSSSSSSSSSSLSEEEFNRIVKRGSTILREAGECLKGRGDEQTAEILLYKSARLLSAAVAMDPRSSLALGHLGNACLLHGELKLKISRDLRTLLSRNKQEQSFLKKEKMVSSLVDVCDECEELLIEAGRNYKLVLSIDDTDARALYNWGLALSFRAELIADTGLDAAIDADKIYLAAIEKFDAVLSRASDCATDALFRWGLALRRRSQLRPRGSSEKAKLLQQAKTLFEDVLRADADNLQVREVLRSCVSELRLR
ncbi:uncharacterized protein LOC144711783 [Wolffia australiana]